MIHNHLISEHSGVVLGSTQNQWVTGHFPRGFSERPRSLAFSIGANLLPIRSG